MVPSTSATKLPAVARFTPSECIDHATVTPTTLDDTFTHKTGEKIPNVGKFYDHTVPGYIWGQNLIYALYADEKTTYPLGFRLYEKDAKRRVELAIDLVDELIEIGVPADTYLFDMSYCSEEFVTHLEGYGKEWVSAVKSDARVTYGGERIRGVARTERVDTVPRTIDGDTYHIWTQKREVGRLGEVKLLITKKKSPVAMTRTTSRA